MNTILVVEDEAVIRTLAVELFEEAGYHVVEFDNAADAIVFCADPTNEIAAVFTDINMPGDLDGLDVAQVVVTTPPSRSECTPMNLVTDCTATSAPSARGR